MSSTTPILFREPTSLELAILKCLLSVDFPEMDKLRAQLVGLKVRNLDADYCLELNVENHLPAPLAAGIPVEASYVNNGEWNDFVPKTHILLHVDSLGFMSELEFYNDELTPILQPDIAKLHVQVNLRFQS